MDRIAQADPAYDSAQPDPSRSRAPFRLYNIGNHQPVELMRFIEAIEHSLGKAAIKEFLPMQAGDVLATYADVDDLRRDVGFEPKTSLNNGITRWAEWFLSYQKQNI